MKQAYLINRKKKDNSYSTFRIANGNSIEMIDLFTINFNNKEELVNYLKTLSKDISIDDDLYIIMKDGHSNIKVYDVLYSGPYNKEIEKAAMDSISKKELNYYDLYMEVINNHSNDIYRKLFREYNFNFYKTFKEFINTSYNNGVMTISNNNHWIGNNYYMYRNAVLSLNKYNELRNNTIQDIDQVIREKRSIDSKRGLLKDEYRRTLENEFGQMNLLSNNNEFITFTSIHPEKIPLNTTIVKNKDQRKTPLDNIEITEAPTQTQEIKKRRSFKVDRESLKKVNFYAYGTTKRKEATKEIMNFIKNLNPNIIKYNGDKYYINYNYFDLDISEEDKSYLNKLITQNMLQLIYNYKKTCSQLNSDLLTYGSMYQLMEDRDYYLSEIRRYLDKYNIKSFNNIYKLYTELSKLISIKKENGRSRK